MEPVSIISVKFKLEYRGMMCMFLGNKKSYGRYIPNVKSAHEAWSTSLWHRMST